MNNKFTATVGNLIRGFEDWVNRNMDILRNQYDSFLDDKECLWAWDEDEVGFEDFAIEVFFETKMIA